MYSSFAEKYLKNIDPVIAIKLKSFLVYPRFYRDLFKGRHSESKFVFVAGLPKSGTTWLENMISNHLNLTQIMPYKITSYELENKESIHYQYDEKFFDYREKGQYFTKLHTDGSDNNIKVLKDLSIKHVLMYRDMRDVAISYVSYVRSTPWHPIHLEYRDLTLEHGLKKFANENAKDWMNWILEWEKNSDKNLTAVVRYEDLLLEPSKILQNILRFLDSDVDEKDIATLINKYSFLNMKNQTKSSFFNSGKSGKWKNKFDNDMKNLYKEKIGKELIELKYEEDLKW
jgi:hypothetical protein